MRTVGEIDSLMVVWRLAVDCVHGDCAHEYDYECAESWLAARTEQARPEPSAREQLIDALADSMNAGAPRPEHVVKAEAIEEVAREFQMGGWTILTAPTPPEGIASLALGQRVTDWLRDRADDALEVQP